MPAAPTTKRAVAFFDGQNLFHAVREAFGYNHPNYDPLALVEIICRQQGWELSGVRFYTGIPDPQDDPNWHRFWTAKLGVLGSRGVYTYSRPLRYRRRTIDLPDGSQYSYLAGHEKGTDVRIALDVVRMALDGTCDVALLFSQDQDLSEVADEIRSIAQQQRRWIKLASAFPVSPASKNRRGINKTDWIRIERATYDRCLDLNDYRRPTPSPAPPPPPADRSAAPRP